MFGRTARVVAGVTALFLCPLDTKGMDCPQGFNPSERRIDTDIHLSLKQGEQSLSEGGIKHDLHSSINEDLKTITTILKSKWGGNASHKIIALKNKAETHACNLEGISDPTLSGINNLPLRKDLLTLLHKPETDPYYTQKLSKKDFMILGILYDALVEEPLFSNQKKALSCLSSILSRDPINENVEVPQGQGGV